MVNIIEEKNNFIIVEADEYTRQGNELEDNEKMLLLIEGGIDNDYVMSMTHWCDGTVTVFDNISYVQWTVEDWETGYNELCEHMDSYDQADYVISELEDFDS